jgi:hypothetical protein
MARTDELHRLRMRSSRRSSVAIRIAEGFNALAADGTDATPW